MKLKLKTKNTKPVNAPEESAATQSADFSNRFKCRLYIPDNDSDVFTTDLIKESDRRSHLKQVSRVIAPCREGIRKGGLAFTVPFLGLAREGKLRKDFAPVFKAIKDIEKKYGVSFSGIVHGDDSPYTVKDNHTETPDTAPAAPKLKKLKLGKK